MASVDEDDPIALSGAALAALQEFRQEQEREEQKFASLQARAQERFAAIHDSGAGDTNNVPDIDDFKEDWQLSQFWYSSETADALAREMLNAPPRTGHSCARVGVLCAPSVYPKLLSRAAKDAWLFEYDNRFEVLAGQKFVKYDYNHPFRLPAELKGTFDCLVIDPPFLSDECEIKAATTARWLGTPDARLIVCSGAKMRDLLLRLYKARETKFKVHHRNGRLSNDFVCLLNYESQDETNFGPLEDDGAIQEYAPASQVA